MASKILNHSFLNAVAGLLQLGAGFACSIVVARLLGAEAVGAVAFSLWMVTTAIAVADGGISIALRRFVPNLVPEGTSWPDARRFGAYLVRPYLLAVLALSALHLLLYRLGVYDDLHIEGSRTLLLTGLVFLVYALGQYQSSLLISAGRYRPLIRLTFASAPLQLLCVWLGAKHFGLDGALLGYLPAFLLFAIATLPLLFARGSDYGLGVGRLVRYSLVSWLSYTVQIIFLYRGEFVFLGALDSHESVGLYSAALSLTNIAMQLPLQAAGALIPFYAAKQFDLASEAPPEAFQATIRAMILLAAPLCFGLAAIAPELMPAIFGEPFRDASGVLTILGATSLIFIFVSFANQFLYATEQPGYVLAVCLGGSVALSLGCLLVVPIWGGTGAALVRGATYLGMACLLVRKTRLHRASGATWRAVATILLSALLCGIAARLVLGLASGWAGICLAIATGALCYGLAVKLLRPLPAQDVEALAAAFGRVPALSGWILRAFGHRPAAA